MAFGRTCEDIGEDLGEFDSMAADSTSVEFRNEGHAFSLKGSAKRLGAMRRAMLVQYRAMTSVRARNARTDTRLATIAVMSVLSKVAIVVFFFFFFVGIGPGVLCRV